MRRNRFTEAGTKLRRHLSLVDENTWRARSDFFGLGLYANGSTPLAENNLGVTQLALGQVTEAEASFFRALKRDSGYAVPHVNLAMIAALAGDAERVAEELTRAEDLGFRRAGAQKAIRRVLAQGNDAMVSALKGN